MVGSEKMSGAWSRQHIGVVISIRIIRSQILSEKSDDHQKDDDNKACYCRFTFHEFFDKLFGFAAFISNNIFIDKIFLKGKFIAFLFIGCV